MQALSSGVTSEWQVTTGEGGAGHEALDAQSAEVVLPKSTSASALANKLRKQGNVCNRWVEECNVSKKWAGAHTITIPPSARNDEFSDFVPHIRRSDPFDAACHASLNSTPKVMEMGVAAPGELRGTLEVPVVKDIIVKDIGVPAAVGSITAWYNIAHRTRTSLTSPRLDHRRPRAIAHGVRAVARRPFVGLGFSAAPPESAKFVANANKSLLGAPRVSRG